MSGSRVGSIVVPVPEARRIPRGDAKISRPYYAPARLGDRPWIVTFVGADESFVDAFFRGVKDCGDGFEPGAFPRLLPVRDFSEPPRAMMDGAGAPSYLRADVEPGAGQRLVDAAVAPELDTDGKTLGQVLVDAGIAADPSAALTAVSPPVNDPARAAWLRKVYLPMHCHFHMVTCNLVCDRPGLPAIEGKRVIESGMVIRRFLPDTAPGTGDKPAPPRWEDWIPSPRGNGIWTEIAREDMTLLAGGKSMDPTAITRADLGTRDAEIFGLLGLTGEEDEAVLALATAKLAALPNTIATKKPQTSRYGFLPIAMGDKEREAQAPLADIAKVREAFADVADRHLKAQLTDHAQAIRDRIRGALLPLFRELRDSLPAKPSTTDNGDARDDIFGIPGRPAAVSYANIDTASEIFGLAALSFYADLAVDSSYASVSARWAKAVQTVRGLAGSGDGPTGLPHSWFNQAIGQNEGAFSTAMLFALRTKIGNLVPAAGPLGDPVDPRLLAGLLLWVRRLRVDLLTKFYASAFGEAKIPSPNPDSFLPNPLDEANPLRVPMTVGPLGAELAAWLATDAERAVDPVPWPSPSLSSFGKQIHGLALVLEQALIDVDMQGAGAGGAYATVVDELAKTATVSLAASLGKKPILIQRGLDLRAQPERGLFAFPGPSPTAATLSAFAESVKGHYEGASADPDTAIRTVEEARGQVIRARFDADHLYAVWCYAKVASRDPCERPQLVWSLRTEVFSLAEPMDLLGLKPVPIRLPDLPKLLRDIPRMKRARALPFAAIATPQDSGFKTGDDPKQTQREWGIAWICSIGIPVFTICAWILFKIIFSILIILPSFAWMLLLKFCIPVPAPKRS